MLLLRLSVEDAAALGLSFPDPRCVACRGLALDPAPRGVPDSPTMGTGRPPREFGDGVTRPNGRHTAGNNLGETAL